MENINLEELTDFLVKAKINTYAGDGKEVAPQRPGFKELEFKEGDWEYRDSYAGSYFAPGQEVVRYKGIPVWAMAYSGGMLPEFHGNKLATHETIEFLKSALKMVEKSMPFRGPSGYNSKGYKYQNMRAGNITSFSGKEQIFFNHRKLFEQNYVGGLIVYSK